MTAVVGQVDSQRKSLCRITGKDEYQLATGDIDVQIFGIGLMGGHKRIGWRMSGDSGLAKILKINIQLVGQLD